MISNIKIVFMVISAGIAVGLPVFLFFKLRGKSGRMIGAVIAGALTFYLFQVVIRIPILQILGLKTTFFHSLGENIFLHALVLGGTAALFETGGRLLIIRVLLKDRISLRTGIIHGVGHGGIEAVTLVGINYVIYIVYSLMLNAGNLAPLSFMILPEQGQGIVDMIKGTDGIYFLVAGLERGMTLFIQIGLSVLITEGIYRQKKSRLEGNGKPFIWIYVGIVLLIHTALDAGAVILSAYKVNVWMIEGYVLVFAIGLICYVMTRSKRNFTDLDPEEDEGEKAVKEGY